MTDRNCGTAPVSSGGGYIQDLQCVNGQLVVARSGGDGCGVSLEPLTCGATAGTGGTRAVVGVALSVDGLVFTYSDGQTQNVTLTAGTGRYVVDVVQDASGTLIAYSDGTTKEFTAFGVGRSVASISPGTNAYTLTYTDGSTEQVAMPWIDASRITGFCAQMTSCTSGDCTPAQPL